MIQDGSVDGGGCSRQWQFRPYFDLESFLETMTSRYLHFPLEGNATAAYIFIQGTIFRLWGRNLEADFVKDECTG